MKFAKLYETCDKHQILVRLSMNGERFCVVFSTYIDDVGIVEVHHAFDEARESLDAFAAVTKRVAVGMISDSLKDLKDQLKTGETTEVMH